MNTPQAADLLSAWEHGFNQSLQIKALRLLELARPDLSEDQMLSSTVGFRDTTLIDLRKLLFGRLAEIIAKCPTCNEQFEAKLDLADLQFETKPDAAPPFNFEIEGYSFLLRIPQLRDLLFLSKRDNVTDASEKVLSNCILSVKSGATEIATQQSFSVDILQSIENNLAQQDPAADIVLDFSCPHCNAQSGQIFDIVSLLVKEVHSWARRMLQDVHVLASAYGWSEDSILAMSAARRQTYLDLVSQ